MVSWFNVGGTYARQKILNLKKYGLNCIYGKWEEWEKVGGSDFSFWLDANWCRECPGTLIYMKTNPQAQALRWWLRYTWGQNGILCFFSGIRTRMAWFTYSLADTEHEEWCVPIFMRDRKGNPYSWACHMGGEVFFVLNTNRSLGR